MFFPGSNTGTGCWCLIQKWLSPKDNVSPADITVCVIIAAGIRLQVHYCCSLVQHACIIFPFRCTCQVNDALFLSRGRSAAAMAEWPAIQQDERCIDPGNGQRIMGQSGRNHHCGGFSNHVFLHLIAQGDFYLSA